VQRVALEIVRQSRCVRKQVLDGDFPAIVYPSVYMEPLQNRLFRVRADFILKTEFAFCLHFQNDCSGKQFGCAGNEVRLVDG